MRCVRSWRLAKPDWDPTTGDRTERVLDMSTIQETMDTFRNASSKVFTELFKDRDRVWEYTGEMR